MPLVSAEVRWFVDVSEEDVIAPFTRWLDGGPLPPGKSETRTDVYAVDRSVTDIGLKTRGKTPGLELKVLVAPDLARIRFAGREAKVQQWSKVSSRVIAVSNDAVKCKVTKTRRMRELVPSCNVEWTLVEIEEPKVRAWTLGLEASGDDARAALERGITELEATTPPKLTAAWIEASYPAWLAAHAK